MGRHHLSCLLLDLGSQCSNGPLELLVGRFPLRFLGLFFVGVVHQHVDDGFLGARQVAARLLHQQPVFLAQPHAVDLTDNLVVLSQLSAEVYQEPVSFL